MSESVWITSRDEVHAWEPDFCLAVEVTQSGGIQYFVIPRKNGQEDGDAIPITSEHFERLSRMLLATEVHCLRGMLNEALDSDIDSTIASFVKAIAVAAGGL